MAILEVSNKTVFEVLINVYNYLKNKNVYKNIYKHIPLV